MLASAATQSSHKLEGLNALRGVAVLLVLFFHFAPGAVPTIFTAFTGVLGIVLFFFLSGFFMDRTLAQDKNVLAFAIKRVGRIVPLYWGSLIAAFIIGNWTPRDVVANALFLIPFTKTELMSGVYWTLYIEIAFYVVVPVIALLGRRAIAVSLYMAIALNVAVAAMKGHPSHTLYYMMFCLAGMQFGLWHRGLISTFYLAAAVVAATGHAIVLSDQPVSMGLACVISSAALWVGLIHQNSGRNVLSTFGDISYSLYLLHAVIGLPVTKFLVEVGMGVWFSALAGVAVSIATSLATYRWIERPCNGAAHIAESKSKQATLNFKGDH